VSSRRQKPFEEGVLVTGRFVQHVRGNVVAYLALLVALGGTSYAALRLPRNSVGPLQIRPGAVGLSKVARSARISLRGTQGPKGDKGDKGETGATGPGAAKMSLTGSGRLYTNPAFTVDIHCGGAYGAVHVARTTGHAIGIDGTYSYGPFAAPADDGSAAGTTRMISGALDGTPDNNARPIAFAPSDNNAYGHATVIIGEEIYVIDVSLSQVGTSEQTCYTRGMVIKMG
jgi:hypothetical protein